MKKFLKTLVVGLCLFTLLCCALPAAFAADKTSGSKKEENVYAIGMDAQGGICSTVVTYTNLSGKLESTPEQPTMTGYTFDGWYTEPVGGSKVRIWDGRCLFRWQVCRHLSSMVSLWASPSRSLCFVPAVEWLYDF